MSDIPTKVCKTCNKELMLGFFNIAKGNKDGHTTECQSCDAESRKKRPSYKKYNKTGGKKWQRMNLRNEPN